MQPVTLTQPPAGAVAPIDRIEDRQGWLSDSFTIRGRCAKRGYARGPAEDGGWFSRYSKEFAGAGLVAHIEFTGAFVPEENIPAAVTALVFEKTNHRYGDHPVDLRTVPPVLLAEAYAAYHFVADGGQFDPDWRKKSEW